MKETEYITPEHLRDFSLVVANEYNAGLIRHPVHLDGGNEEGLIEVFKNINSEDWVCGSWRMHYKCLLKGVSPTRLISEIRHGHSIALCFPEFRIVSSAIVGGVLPIAVGIAWAIKQRGGSDKVWAFLGDMTARTGIALECYQYADGHGLPIHFVVEDNGKSVCTPTEATWGSFDGTDRMTDFQYEPKYPHSGAGVRVNF